MFVLKRSGIQKNNNVREFIMFKSGNIQLRNCKGLNTIL